MSDNNLNEFLINKLVRAELAVKLAREIVRIQARLIEIDDIINMISDNVGDKKTYDIGLYDGALKKEKEILEQYLAFFNRISN